MSTTPPDEAHVIVLRAGLDPVTVAAIEAAKALHPSNHRPKGKQ